MTNISALPDGELPSSVVCRSNCANNAPHNVAAAGNANERWARNEEPGGGPDKEAGRARSSRRLGSRRNRTVNRAVQVQPVSRSLDSQPREAALEITTHEGVVTRIVQSHWYCVDVVSVCPLPALS